MNYTFIPTTLEDITELVQAYLDSLSSPIDSFLEDHILDSQLYVISSAAEDYVGYFGLNAEKLLTQFYLSPGVLNDGQQLFAQVLSHFGAEAAFIPTCDELFLSYALDQEVTIAKQAYFFQDNRESDLSHKIYAGGNFRPATPADIADIRRISDDFFDRLEESVAADKLFVLTEADVLLGVGVIEPGRLLKKYGSVGMYTAEQFRQRGIGRSIILYLKQWCYKHGQIPISGCWYYNFNSKKTLESAGMVTKTRLLKVHFRDRRDPGE